MAIGTTIDGLNSVTSLTAQDEVPVWDKEATGEPTKKITAQNMANSVKSLADLKDTADVNALVSTALSSVFFAANVANLNSASDKASHTINVPNNSLHFLLIESTSTSLHAYGMVASTASGALTTQTMQKTNGLTLTYGTGAITVDLGSTARPLHVVDIRLRGSGFCTLS